MREIEKKYLVELTDVPFDLTRLESVKIYQQYLSRSDDSVVTRIRVIEDTKWQHKTAFITLKSRQTGLSRGEFEKDITPYDAENIMKWSDAPILIKTRYIIPYGHLKIELDVFEGPFKDLVMAEVEFRTEREAERFIPPSWFGADVSKNFEYTNAALAEKVGV